MLKYTNKFIQDIIGSVQIYTTNMNITVCTIITTARTHVNSESMQIMRMFLQNRAKEK